MTAVSFDSSVSLDGFITAPNDRPAESLGDGGQRLHAWVLDTASDLDREVLDELWNGAGALVSGGRTRMIQTPAATHLRSRVVN